MKRGRRDDDSFKLIGISFSTSYIEQADGSTKLMLYHTRQIAATCVISGKGLFFVLSSTPKNTIGR